jgi:hypothetical protein
MSPTVLAVIMIAITEEIFTVLGFEKGDKAADMMMMGMVFCTSIAAGMTPIAHVFPLMAMGYYTTAGGGTISYVQVDRTGIDILNAEAPARTIGGTGHPFVYGAWPGDYWLFEATDGKEYPAGTKLNISFITRVSATGQKYWKLEYWDGQEWKPTEMLQTVTIGNETVEYNFTPTSSTTNTAVNFTWTLAKACTVMQFRYTCVANYAYDGNVYEGLNKGTCRIAGAEGTSPVFKVVK